MTTADKRAVPAQEQAHAASPRADSVAWDPYEVWLKRVKLPREHDATPATDSDSNPTASSETNVVRHVWLRLKPHG